jgi:tetratricopeptide (TPR) repeat protein
LIKSLLKILQICFSAVCYIFVFALLLQGLSLSAQEKRIDSLETVLSKTQDVKKKIDLLNAISYELRQKDIVKATDYAMKSLELSVQEDYIDGQIQANIILGIIYKNSGSFDKAIDYNLIALKLAEDNDKKAKISACLNNIGGIYQSQKNYSQAIDYYKKSLAIEEKLDNKSQYSIRLYNLGSIYELTDSLDLAYTYYYNSLLIEQQLNNPEGIYFAYYGIGGVDLKRGKIDSALESIDKALLISEQTGDLAGMSRCNIEKAKIFKVKNEYEKAVFHLELSIQYADSINYLSELSDAYFELSEVYKFTNDYPQAYKFLNLHLKLNDSINNLEINSRVAELATKYQLEKMEKEIEFFKKESVLQAEKNKSERKSRYYLIISFILALALALSNIRRIIKRGKQILYYAAALAVFIIFLSLIFYFFGDYTGKTEFNIYISALADVVTFSALPIFIVLFLIERILLKRHLKTATVLSETISNLDKPADNVVVKLLADNDKDYIELSLNKLLFIEANDNYSAVCYKTDMGFKKVLLRSTLKRMSDQLEGMENIVRCHKSYIVNVPNISRVSGNAQGYHLHFSETEIEIPVSRNFPKELIQKIKAKA